MGFFLQKKMHVSIYNHFKCCLNIDFIGKTLKMPYSGTKPIFINKLGRKRNMHGRYLKTNEQTVLNPKLTLHCLLATVIVSIYEL